MGCDSDHCIDDCVLDQIEALRRERDAMQVERDEARQNADILGALLPNTKAAHERANKLEATCAAMREALVRAEKDLCTHDVDYHHLTPIATTSVIAAALADGAGEGWLSPTEVAKMRGDVMTAFVDVVPLFVKAAVSTDLEEGRALLDQAKQRVREILAGGGES